MPVLEPDELGTLERGEAPRRLEPRDPGEGVGETGGDDEGLAVAVQMTIDGRAAAGRPGKGVTSGNFT